MKLFLAFVLLVGLSIYAFGSEQEEILAPLYQSGEIQKDDEVTLIMPPKGLKDILSVSNKNGNCLGITEAELTLLSAISFKPGERESDEVIYQKLKKAMDIHQWQPQTISGFTLETFIEAMNQDESPLQRAIKEFQASHALQVNAAGQSEVIAGNPMKEISADNLKATLQNSKKLIQDLVSRINLKTPMSLAVFETGPEKKTSGDGHALIVVGYVRKKGETDPDRFLVLDPNFPGQIKIMKKNGDHFVYDLPAKNGSTFVKTSVLATVMKTDTSNERSAALSKVFENVSSATSKVQINCPPRSDIAAIFEAAAKQ